MSYATAVPPPRIFPNATGCRPYTDFISLTLEDWVANGTLKIWGKVGMVNPPHLVMPLTVEPSKPRLCHDERFLNLWMKDSPFTLDTLKDVPRVVDKGDFVTSCDHKSGYQHVSLTPDSRTYFGVQWAGWFLVFTTLPFGFKPSAYIYQSLTATACGFARSLGVSALCYIDDTLISTWKAKATDTNKVPSNPRLQAAQAVYIMCQLFTRLGYTLSLTKSVFTPVQFIRFLGMIVDCLVGAFRVPDDKKQKLAILRKSILGQPKANLKTLQRFHGKCISLMVAAPAAKLYTAEVAMAISSATKNSRPVPVAGPLRDEITHWAFVDSWEGFVPWRDDRQFKWGASMLQAPGARDMGDFWVAGDIRPIHVKEAHALLNTIKAVHEQVKNHRLDAYVDNMAVVHAWENRKGRGHDFAGVLKQLFELVQSLNIDLKLYYIATEANPADAPSRSISLRDCKLGPHAWKKVEDVFGPHSVDLMALDSNAMQDTNGGLLRHFTPFPTPLSAGVNMFAQDLTQESNPYCFPPFCMLAPCVHFLATSGVARCTLVVPVVSPRPAWWPRVMSYCQKTITLGQRGQRGVLLMPSKQGFIPHTKALQADLVAMRLVF